MCFVTSYYNILYYSLLYLCYYIKFIIIWITVPCLKALKLNENYLLAGVGFAVLVISFLCTVYYNVLIAYVLYYMYESLKSDVPWRHCHNWWNTPNCVKDYKAYKQGKYCIRLSSLQGRRGRGGGGGGVGPSYLKKRQIFGNIRLFSEIHI